MIRRRVPGPGSRVPRLERAGEFAIAEDAATLRLEAVDRLAELTPSGSRPI